MVLHKMIRGKAPLRISLAGGGTDVPPYPEMNGGAVISSTIDRYAYVTIRPSSEHFIRAISQDYDLLERFESVSDMRYNGKLDLVKAAARFMQIKNGGFDVVLHADSPPGSGLGSSSAVAVSLVGTLSKYKGIEPTLYEIADTAYKIERVELGIKGGLQDQYASAFGGFNFIEFKGSEVTVNPLRIRREIINELLASLVLVNTRITRLSAKILRRQINKYRRKNEKVMENLDILKQLAYDMKDSLLKGNIIDIAENLHSSWTHKKQIDSQISSSHIDRIYNSARRAGALGGKLLGAGGGGHLLLLCDPDKRKDVSKQLTKLDCDIVKFNFDNDGLQVWRMDAQKVLA
jgi:D-glycero-alpha-D-manno-heptose-7-phosphate kinase